MTPSLADAVHAVLDRGLVVRDQADAGAPIDWDAERATLIALLDAFEVREEVVSPGGGLDLVFSETGSPEESARLTRATIRFALTCWLDERLPSGWIPSADGWAKFWDEARYAETRSDLDALETMYLCVMLGFRGSWRHEAAQLASWEARVRARLAARASTWTMPAGLDSPRLERVDRDVPSRLTYAALLIGALLVPLVAALLWQIRA